MPEPFSLVRHAWIPVALDDGRRAFVRPCDISEPVDGRAILSVATGRPDCDIALTEFLIGLLAVTMEGTHKGSWLKHYRKSPSPAELEVAFAPLEPAMMLDGEGPWFFQDREQLEGEPTPVEALFIDAPGANTIKDNADHFVKRGRTGALSRAGAAIALLTLQTCAPSGGAGHRTSVRGGGPLTTLVLPGQREKSEPTLWLRLWANVPGGFLAEPNDLKRVFPWLGPTRVSDKAGVATTPEHVHPAQAFFGMPRRIRLVCEANAERRPCDLLGTDVVDDVIITGYVTRPWGTNYTSWSRGHPLSPYYKVKATDPELLPLHLKSSRVGYRQYLGFVAKEGELRLPARCVDEFYARAKSFEGDEKRAFRDSRLLASGYAMDNMKPLDFAEALMPLVVTGSDEGDKQVKDMARRFILSADIVSGQLVSCVRRALFGEKGKAERDSTALEPVRSRFWADTEQDFYRALRNAAEALVSPDGQVTDEPADAKQASGGAWLEVLRRHALAIFDDAVPIEDAESDRIKDVIAGRKMLAMALEGYGPVGKKLFAELQLPERDTKPKKGRKAA